MLALLASVARKMIVVAIGVSACTPSSGQASTAHPPSAAPTLIVDTAPSAGAGPTDAAQADATQGIFTATSEPATVELGDSGNESFASCPWSAGKHATVHDIDFCSCTHRFAGPLSGCNAEHHIYATNSPGHYTTTIRLLTAFADTDADGNDEALLVVRESDMAPTDKAARKHAELVLVTVRDGALVVLARGATGTVQTVVTAGRGFTLRETGTKGDCDVTYAARAGRITPTSPRCP
ncbi:hypothetical protein BH09MYX1_BH09MYX1_51020 [soil metagenome]